MKGSVLKNMHAIVDSIVKIERHYRNVFVGVIFFFGNHTSTRPHPLVITMVRDMTAE